MLIRQFYTIQQIGSVLEYIEQFETIVNHLTSYCDSIHPYYFLTRFVEGLRPDIRAVVLVQRPPDLDTACSLALLQEEVASTYHDPARPAAYKPYVPPRQVPLPLPPPPPRLALPAPPPASGGDRHGQDTARVDSAKLKALREYRHARGLYF